MGLAYDKMGHLQGAESAFKNVLKLDSNFLEKGEVLYKLGLIHNTNNKYDEAILVPSKLHQIA
jgi:tetratricopeptide (TPR) repeat protein